MTVHIDEINRRFLDEVRAAFPDDDDRLRRMSLIGEDGGNMKFMINGASTIGTLDGVNVEIREEAGFITGTDLLMDGGVIAALRAGRWQLQI